MERNIYLELTNPEAAYEKWLERILNDCPKLESEKVRLFECPGRVTAAAISAERSSPAFHGAAMDGYAVYTPATYAASERKPVVLKIGTDVFAVNTGQPLPGKTNAVIKIEDVDIDEQTHTITIEKPAFPWQHVRKTGEDIVATEVLLPPGTRIGAQELGALAAGGAIQIEVFKKPKVAIIPTGSDLVALEDADKERLVEGKELPEFNSLMLGAMVEAAGGTALIQPIAADEPEDIVNAIKAAARENSQLILLNAGTSAGSHDFSRHAISAIGEVLIHGVAMMPGKPTVLGMVEVDGRKIPVAGIPGYPVSAWVAMEEFILPLLAFWQKRENNQGEEITVYPVNALPSRPGMEERLRVKLGMVKDKTWAVPLPRGAGTVTSLSRADAIITIPADKEGLDADQPVQARLLRSKKEIENSLVAIGSHDNALDVIDSLLRRDHPGHRLTSAHTGSLGGLLALASGKAHLAGSHLLDPETGIYNQAAIKQYLANTPVALVRLAGREQGFIVKPGNPRKIMNFEDLLRGDVRFINRQKGSGTRVLLDWELSRRGLNASAIKGYQEEEYTHMNVAQAVLSGRADAGLGVKSAANALGLDFQLVGLEEYDLVIPLSMMEDERIKALLEVIRSKDFKDALSVMGGYELDKTGEVIWKHHGN